MQGTALPTLSAINEFKKIGWNLKKNHIDSLTAVAAYFGRDVTTLNPGIRRLTMKISGPGDGYKHCVCILEQFNIKV